MRFSRLIEVTHAPRPSRPTSTGVAIALLGLLLAKLSASVWLSAVGVLAGAAGIAVLVAWPVYKRQTEPTRRRLTLATALFGVTAAVAIFFWFQRPAAAVDLEKIVPQPGSALTLSGVSSEDSPDSASGEKSPFLEGTFGSLEIAELEPPPPFEERTEKAAFRIRIPVSRFGCDRLKARLGGSCGRSPGPSLTKFAQFEVATLRPGAPLSGEIRPHRPRTLTLIATTERTRHRVPTEWNLIQDSPNTAVDLDCIDGAPLRIGTLQARVRVRCALDGAIFRLTVEPDARFLASFFLSELSEFKAHAASASAETTVDKAELAFGEDSRDLPELPVTVGLQASGGTSINLELIQAMAVEIDEISLSSASASSVKTGDGERLPNLLSQNVDLVYFIAGILFAMLVPALFDFAVVKLSR